jgi:DNA-binding FadR family transcriptional regulator
MASRVASFVTDDSAASSGQTGAFRAEPAQRQRVADVVFDSLARAIITGELPPSEPLATQRDLAKQFNVSALVVRQAIHRLEDLGLVRVRQGSPTIVLDPNEASDIRLIQLRMELSEPGKLAGAALENQALFVLPLLVLAERRITDAELAVLRYITESLAEDAPAQEVLRVRTEFWQQVAKATRNPLFQQQIRWWSSLAKDLEQRGRDMRLPPARTQLAFYRRLTAALTERKGTVQLWLELMKPVLDWFDSQNANK